MGLTSHYRCLGTCLMPYLWLNCNLGSQKTPNLCIFVDLGQWNSAVPHYSGREALACRLEKWSSQEQHVRALLLVDVLPKQHSGKGGRLFWIDLSLPKAGDPVLPFLFCTPSQIYCWTVLELPSNPCKGVEGYCLSCCLLLCRILSITFHWMESPLRRGMASCSGCPRCSRSRRIAALPIPPP